MRDRDRRGREPVAKLSRRTAEKWLRIMIDRKMVTWDDEAQEWAGIIPVYSEATHRGPSTVGLGPTMDVVAEFLRFYPQPRDW